MILGFVWFLLILTTAFLVFFSARLLIFLLAALAVRPRVVAGTRTTRFLVLVPAHDEEKHVRLAVVSAHAQDYPDGCRRVVVLADNCTDRTACVAREAGAEVVERVDPDRRGKHHALRWFISQADLASFDALVILDADTVMEKGYLAALDARLATGALAAQGYNGVLNPDDTPFTRLTYVTNTMKNRLCYAGKAALGLSVPLMNGMAISTKALAEDGFVAESVAEDFETYLRLAARGVRVAFCPEAKVLSLKATGFDEAYRQRLRWSAGQSLVTRRLVPRFLARALLRRSLVLFDAALDLAAPGYAVLTGAHVLVLATAMLLPESPWQAWVFVPLAASLAALVLNFALGLIFAGPTPARVAAVLLGPAFIAWKAAIALRGLVTRGSGEWVRGAR